MRKDLLAALLAAAQVACVAHLQRPGVELLSAEVSEVDIEGATVLCRLEVENPNSVELSVVRLAWKLSVGGRPVAEGTLPEPTRVPANGRATVTLPARVRFPDLPDLVGRLAAGQEVPYELAGTAAVEGPLGVIDLPFSHSGTTAHP